MLLLEGGEQVRHEVLGTGLHRQVQLALQRTLQVRQLHVEAGQALEDIAAGAHQRLGGVSHVELLADVLEQGLTHQFFELADLQADGRLGQRHFLCRTAVRAAFEHGAEYLELAQGHAQQGLAHWFWPLGMGAGC
ncbi:hypothetical protein D9M69_482060 [compost metagenome]